MDKEFKFNFHLDQNIALCTSKLMLFRKVRKYIDLRTSILIMKQMILPYFDNGLIFLTVCPKTRFQKLQKLLSWGLRIIAKERSADSDALMALFNFLPVRKRLRYFEITFMCRLILRSYIELSEKKSTRSDAKMLVPICKPDTEFQKRTCPYSVRKTWNSVPAELYKDASQKAFKSRTKKFLIQLPNCSFRS